MGWQVVPLGDSDIGGALVVVGMPSSGNVGPVAVRFLVEHLKMRVIGMVDSDQLPPASVAWNGVVTGPVQIFATDMACGLDGRCDRLVVVNSDVVLESEWMMPLAGALARWAAAGHVGLVVGLEGYTEGEGIEGIVGAGNLGGEASLKRLEIKPVHGNLAGFNAALLSRCNAAGVPAIGLFAPGPEGEEGDDARAASALLRLIGPLVPNIHVAPGELERQAEDVEAKLLERREQQGRALSRLEDQIARSYT